MKNIPCCFTRCQNCATWRPVVHLFQTARPNSPYCAQELPYNICAQHKPEFSLSPWESKEMQGFVRRFANQNQVTIPVRCELHWLPVEETI